MIDIQLTSNPEDKTPIVSRGAYSPMPTQWQSLTLTDSLGAIFLGILTIILLISWRRAEARYRTLLTRLEVNNGNH